ncbi:type III secretion system stator protein SctL [Roseateles depolymerans]|uniref:Type 3 secretion system stator protein n=1 Tax=Roseateles depolymerans TaxID=76731 RepID=A0A0U3L8D1_9BURK|nr:type III secretion system stator protein SctL [Roseateles depolymerans]ALV07566.1 Type III secretion apparatus protein SctL [Roseateles depolymerans]REG22218.1 type III secretion protein L [Roseateles depolymerans]
MLIWWRGPGAASDLTGVPHGVLRREQLEALCDHTTLLRQAQEQAQALLAHAHEQAEAVRARAQQDAEALWAQAQSRIEAACEEGRAEGERQAAVAWHERQAGHLVQQADAVRGLHEKLAEVVTSAVERIVHSGDRAALFQRAMRSVQSLSRSATALTLKVHPDDAQAARDGIDSVAALQTAGLSVEVVADPALPVGSCVFESDLGVVDASLDIQLTALRQAMSRAVRRAVAED